MGKRTALVAAAALAIGAATSAAAAAGGTTESTSMADSGATGCEASFDAAARLDMESFRDYDEDTWRDMHHPRAETVLASGQRFVGVDEIMRALSGHFAGREAIFEWTELSRFVDQSCHTGIVVYETRYRLPSAGFDQSTTTTVTFVRERGEWKVLFDQGTELPAS